MRVVVLSNAVAGDASADERDVLVQVEAISVALVSRGHSAEHWTCTLDLGELAARLRADRPDVVFNLVESLAGSDRLAPAAALVLEALEVPYTGSPLRALLAAASKIETKQRLRAAGLPTPDWMVSDDDDDRILHRTSFKTPPVAEAASFGDALPLGQAVPHAGLETGYPQAAAATSGGPPHGSAGDAGESSGRWPRTVIVKPVWEHASLGMDDSAVMDIASAQELRERVNTWAQQLGRPCFAEDYIDGREFNLSVLAGPHGGFARKSTPGRGLSPVLGKAPRAPEVLPPAEIDFSAFPAGKPRIVGYQAKWAVDSFEYQHTPRRFDSPAADTSLVQRLCDLARQSWSLFGLAGYARVDFRVDGSGAPWILEINTNPCLSPDAGFAAAITQAGLSYATAIERILTDAL